MNAKPPSLPTVSPLPFQICLTWHVRSWLFHAFNRLPVRFALLLVSRCHCNAVFEFLAGRVLSGKVATYLR